MNSRRPGKGQGYLRGGSFTPAAHLNSLIVRLQWSWWAPQGFLKRGIPVTERWGISTAWTLLPFLGSLCGPSEKTRHTSYPWPAYSLPPTRLQIPRPTDGPLQGLWQKVGMLPCMWLTILFTWEQGVPHSEGRFDQTLHFHSAITWTKLLLKSMNTDSAKTEQRPQELAKHQNSKWTHLKYTKSQIQLGTSKYNSNEISGVALFTPGQNLAPESRHTKSEGAILSWSFLDLCESCKK